MAKRKRLERREKIQLALERNGRFDYDYIPFGKNWSAPNEDYRYVPNAFGRFMSTVVRTLTFLLGPLVLKIVYGVKVVGREKIKCLRGKGAICLMNHFSFLDTLFSRHAVGYYRSYYTVAPQNNKKGLSGMILRCGGVLPFSPNFTAMRNLDRRMKQLLDEGKWINFYPEKAMWVNYQKPRPMKDGAFHYAVKYGVPVVPVFATFRKDRRGRLRKLRIHICDPVYPDEALPKKDRGNAMRAAAEAAWREVYEQAYGLPLVYETKNQN